MPISPDLIAPLLALLVVMTIANFLDAYLVRF